MPKVSFMGIEAGFFTAGHDFTSSDTCGLTALYQLEAVPFLAGLGGGQGVVFDVICPCGQFVQLP